jgi:UPF0755 protein
LNIRIKILLGVLIPAGLIFLGTGLWVWHTLHTPVKVDDKEIIFVIEPGQHLKQIAENLESSGLIPNALVFRVYARYQKTATRIQAGEHRLFTPASPAQILDQLLKARIKLYRLTVPEGLDMAETASVVAKTGMCEPDLFLALCRDPDVIADLGIPSHTMEGFLFPETYFFPKTTTCRQIIEKMVTTFFSVYTPEWEKKSR